MDWNEVVVQVGPIAVTARWFFAACATAFAVTSVMLWRSGRA